ncbi:putative RNA-binding protein EEED8.10 isoform X3 [Rhipicephalus sanguineus]|uniref:putative RNA-binding protein EEED8.10 isoform X3 n=1 Tax=Rhipicephalus sanguineus TaxID=34632 RepID=UPI0020C5469C|nr:putative RNA-binding protein EEED8.10 isoform X3 [Rhipicephalus sanguineus]
MPTSDVAAPEAEEPQGEPGGQKSGGDVVSDVATVADPAKTLESPSYVEELPDDVLLLVLGWLDIRTRVIIERVCHRWKELAKRLWKAQCKLSFTGVFSISQGKPLTVVILRAILSRCGESLRSLDLATASHMLDHRAVKAIGSRCPNLEYLDASGVQLSNASVLQLANRCPKLKTVLLKDCCDVREKSLRRLLRRCKCLEHVDLADMYQFTGECFNIDGLGLRRLVLRGCSGLTPRGISRIATKCSSLTELVLYDCYTIADHDLQSICQNMRTLKTLALARSLYHATSNGIKAIGNLRHLESLDLNSNGSVDDAALAPICTGCTKLRFLNLSNCDKGITDEAMRHVAKCRELRELKINYVVKITDAGMHNLACHGLLQSLEARGCTLLDNPGVLAMVELCRDLRLLDLSGCELVSTPAMESSAAIVAERPHVLTVIVGGTSVEQGDISTDSKGKLKIDYSDYCVESYLSGDIDLEDEDYWDRELDGEDYDYWDPSDYEAGDYDYDYWDPSDYEEDQLVAEGLLRAGGVFIDIDIWNGPDIDDDDLWDEGPAEEDLIAEEKEIADEIAYQENAIAEESAFQENALQEEIEIAFQENAILEEENALSEEERAVVEEENALAEEYASLDEIAFEEGPLEDEFFFAE